MAGIHIVRGELRAALRVAHEGLALDHTTETAVLGGSHQPNPATGPLFLALGVIYYERNRLHLAQQCLEKALELTVQLGRRTICLPRMRFWRVPLLPAGSGSRPAR
jgi:hypothetical protein